MAVSLRLDVLPPSRSQAGRNTPAPLHDSASLDVLSPFVGSLHARVGAALRELLASPLDWRLEQDEIRFRIGDAEGSIGGLAAGAERGTLRVKVPRGATRALRARLADPAFAEAVPPLAAAFTAWWPFRELRDEDFRRICSSPNGRYGVLRIGYRCNQDCHFCWQDRVWPSPPPERFFGWLDEMQRAGIASIDFTGGEPTASPLLFDLAERAHALGMRVSLQSNAIALSRPTVLDRLRASGLETVHASWHSADPELSDTLTRAPGTHAQTSAGIAAALASGLLVDLNCVVERVNAPGLPTLADDVVARFVRPFPHNPLRGVSFSHPTSYHEPGSWVLHQAPFDEIEAPLLDAARRLRAAGVSVQLVGTCGFPLCLLRADPDLVANQPVARDTYHPDELEHRRYHATCERCARRDQCFGLRQEYLDAYGDRGLVPFTTAGVG